MLEIGFEIIELEKVKQNAWNLVGSSYREVVKFNTQYQSIQLNEIIEELKLKNTISAPVWSVTNNKGFVPTEKQFKNQVASNNTKNYKLVLPEAFAYNPARINVGSIAYNSTNGTGCVSPMYIVLKIIDESKLHPEFFNLLLKTAYLHSQIELMAYGSIRQTLSFKDLCKIIIPLPLIEEQQKIVNEHKMIESQKEIISYFEAKVRDKLNSVWEQDETTK